MVLAGLNPGGSHGLAAGKAPGSDIARPNYTIDGITIKGDPAHPGDFLAPDNEREWGYWRGDYRSRGQEPAPANGPDGYGACSGRFV